MSPFSNHLNRRSMVRSLACGSLLLPGIVRQLMAQEEGGNPLARSSRIFSPGPSG